MTPAEKFFLPLINSLSDQQLLEIKGIFVEVGLKRELSGASVRSGLKARAKGSKGKIKKLLSYISRQSAVKEDEIVDVFFKSLN